MLIATLITDALGRIGLEYTTTAGPRALVCRNGWCFTGQDRQITEFMPDLHDPNSQTLLSFPQPSDFQDKWTEISFPVDRYGYGWGLNNQLVPLAAAILLLHAVIVVAHCCHLLYTGIHYGFADTLGDLLALALSSTRAGPLGKSSVGVAGKGGLVTEGCGAAETCVRGWETEVVEREDRDGGRA